MIISRMWPWVCLNIALTICLTLSEASRQATLVGSVYCDTCFHQDFTESSHFISGASVAVECGGDVVLAAGMQSRFWREVKTNEKGEFRVKLPFSATNHMEKIRACFVKLISSSEPGCPVAATATSSSITLKIKTSEEHVFSAGVFSFQPEKQPEQCLKIENRNSNDGLPSPVPVIEASAFGLPYLPNPFQKPLLEPPFPFLGFHPPPDSMFNFQTPPDSMFNPNSQPPPDSIFNPNSQPPPDSGFDPNQFFIPPPPPPPPPSFFSSLPFPPPSFFSSLPFPPPIEPLPDLSQSSPPPFFPFMPPFPPFPFQPSPGFPGMPSAKKRLSP